MPKAQAYKESLSEFAARVGHEGRDVARIRESLQAHLSGETLSVEDVVRTFGKTSSAAKGHKRARA